MDSGGTWVACVSSVTQLINLVPVADTRGEGGEQKSLASLEC